MPRDVARLAARLGREEVHPPIRSHSRAMVIPPQHGRLVVAEVDAVAKTTYSATLTAG